MTLGRRMLGGAENSGCSGRPEPSRADILADVKIAFVVVFAILSVLAFGQAKKSWMWWAPPSYVSKSDRLGYSTKQIVDMGRTKWYDLTSGKWNSMNDVNRNVIVYGYALAQRNNALLSQLPSRERRRLKSIRDELFYLGMACIAVEDSLAGGGTYSIHLPKTLYVYNERLLGNILRPGGRAEPKKDVERIMYEQILRMRAFTLPPEFEHSPVGLTRPDDVRRYGTRIAHHYHRLRRLIDGVDERRRNLVLDFMHEWVIDYIDIRGQASLLRWKLTRVLLKKPQNGPSISRSSLLGVAHNL